MGVVATLLLLSLGGCKDSSPTVVAGTYTGTATGARNGFGFTDNITFTLAQNGSQITGTWASNALTSGSITGILSGSTLNGSLTQTNCSGSLPANAQVENSGKHLSGVYSGAVCGQTVSATFVVDRVY